MENNNSNTRKPSKLERKFQAFAEKIDGIVGSPFWFVFSLLLVVVWIPSGFFLGFNEIWHLLINTTTTILTFLMLSLLHATETKWEKRIERLQQREATKINEIKKETQKINLDPNSAQVPPADSTQ